MRCLFLFASGMALASYAANAAEGDTATAELSGDGISGEVRMVETASGTIHVTVSATGVPEGVHGFHVHESGDCDAEGGFKSAGGHLARGLNHGIADAGGPHPGDLPNIHVQSDGVLQVEYFTRGFTLGQAGDERLMDDNGSSVILHEKADDYATQPSGDAGDRIACGALNPAS